MLQGLNTVFDIFIKHKQINFINNILYLRQFLELMEMLVENSASRLLYQFRSRCRRFSSRVVATLLVARLLPISLASYIVHQKQLKRSLYDKEVP